MELKTYFAQDQEGNIQPNAYAYLYIPGTTSLVDGIQNQNGNALTNPFQANEDGQIQLAAPDGTYDLHVSTGGRAHTMRVTFLDTTAALSEIENSVAQATAEAERAETARDAAQLSAGIYPDAAAGLAATIEGDYFSVPSAEGNEYLVLYLNESNVALEQKRYPSAQTVEKIKFEDTPCFVRYKNESLDRLLSDYHGSFKRGHIYKSIRSMVLTGFDSTRPVTLRALWNSGSEDSATVGDQFRFQLYEWNGNSWVVSFDETSSSISMTALGFSSDQVVTYTATNGDRKVEVVIDLAMVPTSTRVLLNDLGSTEPEMVVNLSCFSEQKASTAISNFRETLESPTLTLHNDYFSSVWARYSDLTSLENQWEGEKRKTVYQCIKYAELYGFDETRPLKLDYFWSDLEATDGSLSNRVILSEWNGTSWVRVYDPGKKEKTAEGIIDGQMYRWDFTDQGRRAILDIDYTNAPKNHTNQFNVSEPEFIFSPSCFKKDAAHLESIEIRLQKNNACRPYVTSRRKPIFAFIWDDLNDSDALVFDVFQDYGFLPNFALKGSNINASSIALYQEYYLRGCSILAHSMTHPSMSNGSSLTIAQADAQMYESKALIESYGMRVSGWVTPQSTLSTSFTHLMEKNFGYGFTSQNNGLYDATVDPVKMGRFGIESAMIDSATTQPVKDRIDTAIANNELVVFYGHKLPSTYTNTDGTSRLTESDLREILAYLKTKTDENLCEVLSSDEAVLQYYKQPFA